MKWRPILFSAPMVRALLAGTKTQTRRALKPQPEAVHGGEPYWFVGGYRAWQHRSTDHVLRQGGNPLPCPYGEAGAGLWVRETWAYHLHAAASASDDAGPFVYAADGTTQYRLCDRWRPSIHMPRSASRISLAVTAVRVERLQDISEADAIAEGGTEALRGWWTHEGLQWNDPGPNHRFGATPIDSYRVLWESINGPGSWDANPWVWVVEFKRVEAGS